MPRQGLSLLGFMNEQEAMAYLQKWSVLPEQDRSPEGMRRIWIEAKVKVGKPLPRPGKPQMQPLSSKYSLYLDKLTQNPLFQFVTRQFSRFGFMLVEIDPLLAYQFHILTDKSEQFGKAISRHPSVEEMLEICLPHKVTYPDHQTLLTPNGVTIMAQDLNLMVLEHGRLQKFPDGQLLVAGAMLGASPFMQVIQVGGRFYLNNGFHRSFALVKADATHMPCLYLEATNFAQIGAIGAGATFEKSLLESAVPPTIGYFTHDRAYPLQFKHFKRVINVLWNQYEVEADEGTTPPPDNQEEP